MMLLSTFGVNPNKLWTDCVFQIKEIVFLKNTVMECEACGESIS